MRRTASVFEVLAIGTGHDDSRDYERAVTITAVEQLTGAMTESFVPLVDSDPRALRADIEAALKAWDESAFGRGGRYR